MNFLALIIALLIRQSRGVPATLDRSTPWWRWLSWSRRQVSGEVLQLLMAVALPALLLAWLLAAIDTLLFGLPWLALATWLLLFSFGRGDFQADLRRYRDLCAEGNAEGAWLHAQAAFNARGDLPAADFVALQWEVEKRLCYEGYQRWFAVVFWFLLLGPAGGLAYRLLQWFGREVESDTARRARYLLDWVPVQLLALAFALAGDFVRSRAPLTKGLLNLRLDHAAWLGELALAAAGQGQAPRAGAEAALRVDALSELLSRSKVAWLAVLALLTILA
jgi:AmpE protein